MVLVSDCRFGVSPVNYPDPGHEKNSTNIVSLPLIQEGQLSVTGERMCTKYW